jgi:hypothetical protein
MASRDTTAPTLATTDWTGFAATEPDLAAAVRARFEVTKHHVLATLRRDGSPRVSGTEVVFSGDDLLLGSMWRSMKALDLQRDGRFALHSNPGDGSMGGGDAKLSGVALEVVGELHAEFEAELQPPGPFHLFRLELSQVVHSSLHPDGDRMVIRSWRPGSPVTTVERV